MWRGVVKRRERGQGWGRRRPRYKVRMECTDGGGCDLIPGHRLMLGPAPVGLLIVQRDGLSLFEPLWDPV